MERQNGLPMLRQRWILKIKKLFHFWHSYYGTRREKSEKSILSNRKQPTSKRKEKIEINSWVVMKAFNPVKSALKLLLVTIVFCIYVSFCDSQPPLPQRTLTVTATQAIHFGTFCVTGSGGGTVTVGFNGNRTSTGDILLLSIAPTSQPAIFEVKLCRGRNVIITFSPVVILSNSHGGSLTLHIGPTEYGMNGIRFMTNSDCNFITPLRVGGTLDVPGNSSPGIYTGSFEITFNQE